MTTAKRHALQIVTGTTGGWQYAETVREVRPSCLPALTIRNALRDLMPGTSAIIAGVFVYRSNRRARYEIDGVTMTFENALNVLSEREAA